MFRGIRGRRIDRVQKVEEALGFVAVEGEKTSPGLIRDFLGLKVPIDLALKAYRAAQGVAA